MQERYRCASRMEKSRLLDDMEAVTHLGRKHLIALMNRADLRRRKRSRERQRIYDAELVQALTKVADTLDWICADPATPGITFDGTVFDRLGRDGGHCPCAR